MSAVTDRTVAPPPAAERAVRLPWLVDGKIELKSRLKCNRIVVRVVASARKYWIHYGGGDLAGCARDLRNRDVLGR